MRKPALTEDAARLRATDLISDWLIDDWEDGDPPWVIGMADLRQLREQITREVLRAAKESAESDDD